MTGRELIAWQKARGIDDHELANLAGVSWRTVHRWHQGEAKIPKLLELVADWWPTTKGAEQ